MIKLRSVLLMLVGILFSNFSEAQMYTYTAGTNGNIFPFQTTIVNNSNRCQYLYTPSNFPTAPSGNITKIYVMVNTTVANAGTFSNLTVKMGSTSITGFTSGPFVGGLTTVYSVASAPYTNIPAGSWYEIVLQTPFPYSNTSNLIVDISLTEYTGSGINVRHNTAVPASRLAGPVTGVNGTTAGALLNLGFDIGSANPIPSCIATPTAPANASNVCVGSTTLSWPASSGATAYDVYLNTGSTATTLVAANQTGTTYSATVAVGSYAWKIVPKNANGTATGCSDFTFTVNPNATPSVSVAANPGTTICGNTSVTFTATPTTGGTTPIYQWKKNGTNVGTNSPAYTDNSLANADAIVCELTSNAACTSPATVTSTALNMTVNPRPVKPTVTIAVNVLTSSATSGNQWYRNNTTIAGATNQTYTATTAGHYQVLVTNANNCSNKSDSLFYQGPNSVPGIVSTDGIQVSPIPFENSLAVEVAASNNVGNIIITDCVGKTVYRSTSTSKKIVLDLKDLTSGIYLLSYTNDEFKRTVRIVKR